MRLETIIMINRAPFNKLRLDLTDENVIVLSGINGVGKTAILSHVVDAFYELAKGAYCAGKTSASRWFAGPISAEDIEV